MSVSLSVSVSSSSHVFSKIPLPPPHFLLPSIVSDQKPLSVEVDEASTLRLLGAEQENAELRRRLEELRVLQEVRARGLKVMALEFLPTCCRSKIKAGHKQEGKQDFFFKN